MEGTMSLIINTNNNEDFIEILPIGEIDIYTSPMFKKEVIDIINAENKNIVVNSEKLDYLDSTGLGVFMSILKTIKEKNLSIKLKNVKPNIYKLFDITGLNKIFNIEEC
ncbi:MAG TPA: anti-sigma factor antagonist [Clostridiales bacterium]|nr:anti-sigma factor antagonist [Clostridiales bacterium]